MSEEAPATRFLPLLGFAPLDIRFELGDEPMVLELQSSGLRP